MSDNYAIFKYMDEINLNLGEEFQNFNSSLIFSLYKIIENVRMEHTNLHMKY